MMKYKIFVVLLFCFSLIAFYFLNHYTGIVIDDFAYANFGKSVSNVSSFIEVMNGHYHNLNGRLLVNSLAILFLKNSDKIWFDVANTIVFGLFQILIYCVIGIKRKDITITSYLAFLTMCWFLLPGPNHTLLWLDGSFNYLWASTFVLVFLYVHQRIMQKEQINGIWIPFLFLLGFFSGGTHEVISLGVSGALFFYYIANLKKFRGGVIPLIIGFFLGTLFVVLAPGNLVRVHSGGPGEATATLSIAQRVWGMFSSIPSMIPVILLVIVLCFQWWKKRDIFKNTIEAHSILLLSTVISLFFISVVGAFQERVFFGVSLFSLIVLHSLMSNFVYPFKKIGIIIAVFIFSVGMMVEYISVFAVLKANKAVFDMDEISWRTSKDNVFELHTKKMNRFVSTGLGGMDRNFWSNKAMSWYYGKEYMVFVPSDIYQNTYKTNNIEDKSNLIVLPDSSKFNFYLSAKSQIIVLPISDKDSVDMQTAHRVTYLSVEPIPCRHLDIRQRVVKAIYGTLPIATNNEKSMGYILETSHGKYLYFKSPSLIPISKLKSIQIE
ncbi:MAG: DUF6056 family protein [Bacteroidales bacterium]